MSRELRPAIHVPLAIMIVACAACFAVVPARAAAAPATAPAATRGAPRDEDVLVPEVDLQEASLEELIAILQKGDPTFKALVFRDNGVSPEIPRIDLKVKGASRKQILDLLSFRNRNIEMVPLAGGPELIHTFQVARPANGRVIEAAPYVKVYPLSAAVQRIVSVKPEGDAKPPSQKEALDHVLSLIKAAAGAQESPDGPPLLQVHAETQVLIVRGTTFQHQVLDDVLTALTKRTAPDRELEAARDRESQVAVRVRDLMDANERLKKSEDSHIQDILEKTQQIERLKVRLEELEKRVSSKP